MFAGNEILRFAILRGLCNISSALFDIRTCSRFTCQTVSQSVISLLHYFTPSLLLPSSGSVPSLMPESLREVNKSRQSL